MCSTASPSSAIRALKCQTTLSSTVCPANQSPDVHAEYSGQEACTAFSLCYIRSGGPLRHSVPALKVKGGAVGPGGESWYTRRCYPWGRKAGNAGTPWSGVKEGGTRAEVQSARAYNDMQHLTMANASPSERAVESRVIPAELEEGCPNRASVYRQQTPPCGLTRAGGNYHPIQIPQ